MRPESRVDLVVFDWDGTLMDSVGSIVACTRATLAELALGEPDEAAIRGTVGLGLRETAERLVPGCDEPMFARLLSCYRRHWVETYRDRPPLFPGVQSMLDALAGAGYLLAVATGKTRRGLDHALEQTGLRGRFDATRTVDEAPSKPDPRMLLDILDELGVRPQAAIVVGDSIYDLQMAANAGSAAVAVLSGAHCRDDLAAHRPRAVLKHVGELRAWLANQGGRPPGAPAG